MSMVLKARGKMRSPMRCRWRAQHESWALGPLEVGEPGKKNRSQASVLRRKEGQRPNARLVESGENRQTSP